ncbi:hypothetical protein P4475_01595 [Halalkalibacterium halodurans]|uniref:hypothetical protein n=1 Tax=Halalkalibacterium halodurans TaxID=86665 RepID=UPI0006A9D8C9|nr:hypothetical protein [Halalkalibacterium halodurans]MED3645530.1 hypothetical protein [Halalkalibacterium halodurans]TES55877.1 hypothetical protein E2L07_06480 [Halalkalibacterium halodurans]TPE69420.1 hypothetical protein AMD02_008120 [Halalkalibacterium halodurans]
MGDRVEQEAANSQDMWQQLVNGCRAFLTAAVESQNHRILLIDGPAVLGWDTFRMMDQKYSMNSLREQLQLMQEHGQLLPVSIDALTHCLSGAMNEAALWLAENPQKPVTELMTTLEILLEGFRQHPTNM